MPVKRAIDVAPPRHPALRPYSSTAGRLPGALAMGLMLHRPDIPFRKWTPERIDAAERLAERMGRRYDMDDDTLLSLGSSRPLRQLARVWKRKDTSLPTKLLGTAGSPLGALIATLTRSPHYDPWSDTAVLYDPEESIESHELGHAADYKGRRLKALYALGRAIPGVDIYQEDLASRLGMAATDETEAQGEISPEERERRRNMLQRAIGTYIGGDIAKVLAPPAVLPAAVMGGVLGRMGMAPDLQPRAALGARVREKVQQRRRAAQRAGLMRRLSGLA